MKQSYFFQNHQGGFVYGHHYPSAREARESARELGQALGIHFKVVWLVQRKISSSPQRKGAQGKSSSSSLGQG